MEKTSYFGSVKSYAELPSYKYIEKRGDLKSTEIMGRYFENNPDLRDKFLSEANKAISRGTKIIHVIGEGGVGKTMFASYLNSNLTSCLVYKTKTFLVGDERFDAVEEVKDLCSGEGDSTLYILDDFFIDSKGLQANGGLTGLWRTAGLDVTVLYMYEEDGELNIVEVK